MLVLDTNVLSALMRPSLNNPVVIWLDSQAGISVWTTAVSVMEIRFGLTAMPIGRRRDQQIAEFKRIMDEELERRVLAFDSEAAEETGLLMGSRQIAGRSRDLRDSMIAGIVIAQRATLATRNVRHFDDLPFRVVDPWKD
jgi:toxin FitB